MCVSGHRFGRASTQQQTVSEIRTLNEEAKATSFAEIMKQELEKSLDHMTVEIQTVKSTLSGTKTDAAEVPDRENRRLPNSVVDACTVNAFKTRLDKFWKHLSVKFDFTADLTGTGNRSEEVIK